MDNDNSQLHVQTGTTGQPQTTAIIKTTVNSKDNKVENKKVKSKGPVGLLRPRKRIRYVRFTSQKKGGIQLMGPPHFYQTSTIEFSLDSIYFALHNEII